MLKRAQARSQPSMRYLRDAGWLVAMLKRLRICSQAGAGTSIGVAILFPILMLVIVLIHMLTESTRMEQAVQATATRAAQTASLCCRYTGGTNGAEAVVQAAMQAAEDANALNRIFCNNDLVADTDVVFIDVDGNDVPNAADQLVPPGGVVYVFATCEIPPQAIGGIGVPGLTAERRVVGVAAIDPYRTRWS